MFYIESFQRPPVCCVSAWDSAPSDTVSNARPSVAPRETTWERSQDPLSPLRPASRAPAEHEP